MIRNKIVKIYYCEECNVSTTLIYSKKEKLQIPDSVVKICSICKKQTTFKREKGEN